MRSYMRGVNLGEEPDESIAAAVGHDRRRDEAMYRLLAIAKYEDRYVIPTAHAEQAHELEETRVQPGLRRRARHDGSGPFGEASGRPVPVSVETFHALTQRQTHRRLADPAAPGGRVNLLNWDGKGTPAGLFPAGPDAGTAGRP